MILYIDKYTGINPTDTHTTTDWYIFNTTDVTDLSKAIWNKLASTIYSEHAPDYTQVKYCFAKLHFTRADATTYTLDTPVSMLTPFTRTELIHETPIYRPRLLSYTDKLHTAKGDLVLNFNKPYPSVNRLLQFVVFIKVNGINKTVKRSTSQSITFTYDEIYKGGSSNGKIEITAFYKNTNNVMSEAYTATVADHSFVYTGPKLISTEEAVTLSFSVVPDAIRVVSKYDVVNIPTDSILKAHTLQDGVDYTIEANHNGNVISFPIKTTSLNATRTHNPNALTTFKTITKSSTVFKDVTGLVEQLPNGSFYFAHDTSLYEFEFNGELLKTIPFPYVDSLKTPLSTVIATPNKFLVNYESNTKTGIVKFELVNGLPEQINYNGQSNTLLNFVTGRTTPTQSTRFDYTYDSTKVYFNNTPYIDINDIQYQGTFITGDTIKYLFQPNYDTLILAMTSNIVIFDLTSKLTKGIISKSFTLNSNIYLSLHDERCVVFDLTTGHAEVLDVIQETITDITIPTGVGLLRHTNETFTILKD